jgi:hypothetical protein
VSTASDGNKKVVLSAKVDSRDNVSHVSATHNQDWVFVDHSVVDFACRIVAFIASLNEFPPQACLEGFDLLFLGKHARSTPTNLTVLFFLCHKTGSFLRSMFTIKMKHAGDLSKVTTPANRGRKWPLSEEILAAFCSLSPEFSF